MDQIVYKAIIVDDHKLFRKGIAMIINDLPFIEVIAEANDGAQFLNLLNELEPDVVLMDIKMPNVDGIEATAKAMATHPHLKIIALSMFGEVEYYNKMMEAGVKGFILKNSELDELKGALEKVLFNNETYFSQELLLKLLSRYKNEGDQQAEVAKLSTREHEILQYICKGLSNQEIADKVYLSPRTVESHRAKIMTKTETKNAIQLVVYAIKYKLYNIV